MLHSTIIINNCNLSLFNYNNFYFNKEYKKKKMFCKTDKIIEFSQLSSIVFPLLALLKIPHQNNHLNGQII